ncbi:hypothetical protein [Saccharospirillum sp.]|uniref:hypothetical protein n=1 Tax=Saccharospirillum sp. TaxID=2033801 RepID=UPI00349FEB7C
MNILTTMFALLILLPGTVFATPGTGFWELCSPMMSGMGWIMMLPMMIMPLLLLTLLILGSMALVKYLKK